MDAQPSFQPPLLWQMDVLDRDPIYYFAHGLDCRTQSKQRGSSGLA
jgi:hypothetical protein